MLLVLLAVKMSRLRSTACLRPSTHMELSLASTGAVLACCGTPLRARNDHSRVSTSRHPQHVLGAAVDSGTCKRRQCMLLCFSMRSC